MEEQSILNSVILTEKYIHYTLEHNEKPKSVYLFTKHLNINESEFYQHFGSFKALEGKIFLNIFHEAQNGIIEEAADSKRKLSALYHAYFEKLVAHRSLVLLILKSEKNPLDSLSILNDLKKAYKNYVKSLDIKVADLNIEQAEQLMSRSVVEISWAQFLVTFKYWMKDDSAAFTKTHEFIEKSIDTGFSVLNSSPLDSIVDLGNYVMNEIFNKNK